MTGAVARGERAEPAERRLALATHDGLTGLAGLGFASLVLFQNVFLLRDSPLADASIAEISEFYLENEGAVAVALALVAINIPLLLLFASGFTARVQQIAGGIMPLGGRVGYAGAIGVAITFAVVSTTQAALVANAATLAGEPALTQLLWDLHSGAFAFSQVVLALTLGAFAWAGRSTGLTPAWLAYLAFAGSATLIVSGAAVVPSMDGSPIGLLGLLGFLIWLFWLAFTSVRLVRAASSAS
jgi:hypothetical protein